MEDDKYYKTNNELSLRFLLLCIAGLIINLIFSKLVIYLGLPLYVDNVGSIVVAVLGGPILGMAVGFLSNILGSLSTPISMYYSIFTIMIAWLASVYARRGLLATWRGWLVAAESYVILGGGAGSVVTWLLYGQTISGIAEPYALVLAGHGIPPFFAQLTVDIVIDIPDKLLTVFLAWLLLRMFPEKQQDLFPFSYWYYRRDSHDSKMNMQMEQQYRHPLKHRLVGIVTAAVVLIGIFSLFCGTYYYKQELMDNCRYVAQMTSAQMDINTDIYREKLLVYIIRNAALLFAVILLASYITTWFVNRYVTEPIQKIVHHTKALGKIDPELWLESGEWKNKLPVCSGDELEELYNAVIATEENTSNNVKKRMDAEQELLQTRALEEANHKLEEMVKKADEAVRIKNDFYARMSHDMRTPMNGILGITELAKDEDDPEVLHSELRKIKQSGIYMLSLINDTLDLQRMEADRMILNPEICKVRDVVEGALIMVQNSAAEKGVHLEVKNVNADFNGYIRVDPVRVRQIMMNLVSNAIKFTPAGGTVSFEIEVLERTEKYVRDKVKISDTGIGMSEDFIQNNLFVPFMQEKNEMTMQYAGSGLGLSIVKRLLDMMDAKIEVQSELGSGTTFTIWIDFELVPEEESREYFAKKHLQVANNESVLVGKRILLCEDHPLNAEISRRLIERGGGTCEWARDGREGVHMVESHGPSYYDAVLMDIRMPVMNGLEAAAAIRGLAREDTRTLPIIAMSANAYQEDVDKSIQAGMNAHLAKPVDTQLLYATLVEVLGEKDI